MKRLNKNHDRYVGETIDIAKVLAEIDSTAQQAGWRADCFLSTDKLSLRAYHRAVPRPKRRLYVSTGIHGDEPAGPLAALELLRQNPWIDEADTWLCPCLNPTGFALNRRENAEGHDLNRDYRHLLTEEIRAHTGWLSRQPPFDVTVVLHEDWEANGFYLYELNPDHFPSLAEAIIEQVAKVCPIEMATVVDNWAIHHGIIRPNVHPQDRPQWPEAIYLISHKTRLSYTMEAPSDFPLPIRIGALVTAVQTVLDLVKKGLPPG